MSGGFEIVLWALLLAASVTDLVWGKVFNGITLPFLAVGILYRLAFVSPRSAGEGLLAAVVAFLVFFPLWQLRAFAAGDVKLLMAVGAWTDLRSVLILSAVAVVIGAVVGAFVLLRQRGLRGGAVSLREHLRTTPATTGTRIPFAPAFLCAFAILRVAEMRNWTWL